MGPHGSWSNNAVPEPGTPWCEELFNGNDPPEITRAVNPYGANICANNQGQVPLIMETGIIGDTGDSLCGTGNCRTCSGSICTGYTCLCTDTPNISFAAYPPLQNMWCATYVGENPIFGPTLEYCALSDLQFPQGDTNGSDALAFAAVDLSTTDWLACQDVIHFLTSTYTPPSNASPLAAC